MQMQEWTFERVNLSDALSEKSTIDGGWEKTPETFSEGFLQGLFRRGGALLAPAQQHPVVNQEYRIMLTEPRSLPILRSL